MTSSPPQAAKEGARLVLASSSPRRLALLQAAGVECQQCPPEVDETPLPNEPPAALVARLANAKAHALASASHWVLAADTVVALDGAILGKPTDREDGIRMLKALSGKEHRVLTGFALVGPGPSACEVVETRLRFRCLADSEICAYWSTGEPRDKAGAYSIQGQGGRFVESIEGSYTNVVGLPMEAVSEALRCRGIPCAAQLANEQIA